MAPSAKPTQDFVPIEEIRNGLIVLKDNSMRAVLMASSINFALKSIEEQNATLMQFQHFLNSIEFPIQFVVQSRDLDIRPYIVLLENRHEEQVNELMKVQTKEYIEFVKNFVDSVNVMTKSFFVVVPYSASVIRSKKSTAKSFFSKKKEGGENEITKKRDDFEEKKSQIEQRVSVVTDGLTRCGIRIAQLGTEEIVELFYKTFNPGELGKPTPVS